MRSKVIAIDTTPDEASLQAIHAIARAERLTFYDAAYVELAVRAGAALASRDSALLSAAVRRGVQAMDLR